MTRFIKMRCSLSCGVSMLSFISRVINIFI